MARTPTAIVLCGGLGTRLRAVVSDRPKPMAAVGDRPFLEWILLALRAQGVRSVVLATGHFADAVEEHVGDGRRWGMSVRHSYEEAPLGTGGAARLALDATDTDPVLVLNGDSFCPFDLAAMMEEHERSDAAATMWLVPVVGREAMGSVELEAGGAVRSFREKVPSDGDALASAGIYLVRRRILAGIPAGQPASLERDLFPSLVGSRLRGVRGSGPLVDIGTPETYRSAFAALQEELAMVQRQAAVTALQERFASTAALQERTAQRCAGAILDAAAALAHCLRDGGKVLLCGNGGSAADCQHVAAELVSTFDRSLQRPGLPAIALTTDTSILTAYANDFGYDGVFARQVEALGRPGDVLIAISTGGSSRNVLRAVEAARTRDMVCVGLTGQGGTLAGVVDHAVAIPSSDTQLIQECLLTVEHSICELVERELYGAPAPD